MLHRRLMRTSTHTVCSSGIFNLRQRVYRYNPAGMVGLVEDSKGETDTELAPETLMRLTDLEMEMVRRPRLLLMEWLAPLWPQI